jgi:hypothetical protein
VSLTLGFRGLGFRVVPQTHVVSKSVQTPHKTQYIPSGRQASSTRRRFLGGGGSVPLPDKVLPVLKSQ